MPSPFERMLKQVSEQAQRDPAGAFDQLGDIFGKSLTDVDVRHAAALAAHIGGAGLGRWQETIAFLKRCLEHPAMEKDSESERSVWRAICVMHTCADDQEQATDAFAAGVRNVADHCRVAIMCAQTMIARKQYKAAVTQLRKAEELCPQIDGDNEVIGQVAAISGNIARVAESLLGFSKQLLLAADGAAAAACNRFDDWQTRHKALYQQARGFVLAGKPSPALALVQQLMELEEAHQAGPVQRFFTANIACRAQIVRGQLKVAAGAYKACQDFATAVGDGPDKAQVDKALAKLTADLEADKAERDRFA